MTDDFKPHPVEWTRLKSTRFWDHYASTPHNEDRYFSKTVGRSLLRVARRRGVDLSGRLLDYGCGPGFLLEEILNQGGVCSGVDFSPDSVREASERVAGRDGLESIELATSVPTSLDSESFDVVFFVETVEHLLNQDIRDTLAEIHRLLRPGGQVVLTTPNEENLAASEVMCPDCGGRFHMMQHLRSWSARSLSGTLKELDFGQVSCRPTYLTRSTWQSIARAASTRILGHKLPHLMYIGEKGVRG